MEESAMKTPEMQSVWKPVLDLGEGPIWHPPSERFLFVDIHGHAIHSWNPKNDERQSWTTPERVGWLIARADGDGFMAGLQSGFARVWLDAELRLERWDSPHPNQPDVRMNDAKADCLGRIWAGSMNNRDPSSPDGQLARLDPDGSITLVEKGIHIANGPAIAPEGTWMLHTDSWLNSVYRYRIGEDGLVYDKTLWRRFSKSEGTPDGMTLDANGNVWIAFWGGACIRQFNEHATMLQQIDLPALQITSMAFGGATMDQMLVTSARNGLSPEQLSKYPQSGSAFLLQPGVRGFAACTFGGRSVA